MFESFKDVLGKNMVTMSGEIVISAEPGLNMGVIHTFDRNNYQSVLRRMKGNYKFLQFEQHDGISEIYIKMFALKKACGNDNFLDEFNEDLRELVRAFVDEEDLCVRLNIFGEFNNGKSLLKYRYLNNHDDVRYKITDEEGLSACDKLNTPLVRNCLLALAVAIAVGYQGYLYWQDNYSEAAKNKTKIEQTSPQDNQTVKKNETAKNNKAGQKTSNGTVDNSQETGNKGKTNAAPANGATKL